MQDMSWETRHIMKLAGFPKSEQLGTKYEMIWSYLEEDSWKWEEWGTFGENFSREVGNQ